MNEAVKTVVFLGVAALVGLIAWGTRPRAESFDIKSTLGGELFEFDDPTKATSLVIKRFNEELGQLRTFEVAKDSRGRWSIPSHDNYPADAKDQMRDAALLLIDLKKLDVASELEADHKLLGVVEPKEDITASTEGVGTLVVVKDAKGDTLASLVIGGAAKGREGQRYVRVPGTNAVYVVPIDPEKLTTKFEDWIEKDLLQLNSFDVRQVKIMDYSLLPTGQGRFAYSPRMELKINNNSSGEWELETLSSFDKQTGKPIPSSLLAGEELNKQKLDDLKTAVDDLKIVDVMRKPQGLRADLKAGEDFLKDNDAVQSLIQRGFLPRQVPGGDPEFYASNGEVHVSMQDGVKYVLRFGNISGTGSNADELNRFLLVMAQVDPEQIPEPAYPDLPPLDPPKEEAPKGDDAAGDAPKDKAAADDAAADDAAKDDAAKDDAAKDDAAEDDAAKDDADPKADKTAEDAAAAARKAERDRIEKERERLKNEYQEKLDTAKNKVKELNARFADWYYVISEDVYRKVRLGRSDVIKESDTAKETGFDIDAFRALEKGGIDKPEPAPAPPTPGGFPGGGFPGR